MIRRIAAAVVCILLVFASGCEFFPVPSASPGSSASASVSAGTGSTEPSASASSSTVAPTEAATEAPTEEPTAEPTPTPDPTEGMIFPNSDTELLMWDDLIVLDAKKLDLARNEIFARAGYKFTNSYYTDYFGKFSWYKVDTSFSESQFTEIQLANIHLIQAAEDAIKGLLHYIPSGTKLDFDQDGTLETLTYSAPDDYHMNLKMKDGGTTTSWNINCDTPSKKVYLGDIDFQDGMLDLFVDEFGPSDDYALYVAGIKHHSFLKRTPSDTLPGVPKSLKLNGHGIISTTRRMDILMTWFSKVNYKLNSSGKIVFVPQSSYSMENFICKTKVNIPLKSSASSSSAVAFTIPAGTTVKLVSTDDKKWIKIKAPGGTGWLQMADLMTLANPYLSGMDAFDGLIMAD